jgi:hypothetical protein
MKNLFVLGVTAVLLLSVAGCQSAPAPAVLGTPEISGTSGSSGSANSLSFANNAYRNASEDVLVGIGTYKIGSDMSKLGTGRTFAETRARADIARQLNTIVRNMVNDYTATSELDPAAAVSFQETITQTLAKAELRGARTVNTEVDDNGLLWVAMEFSKPAAVNEVNQAANAAKLAVPAAIAFDALQRMETAFSKEAGGGPVPVGD